MSEYSWRSDDDRSGIIVPDESLPKRIALTATGVVTKMQPDGTIVLLLCNPHPDSWNSWMLPYGSLVLDVETVSENLTFGKLGEYMENMRMQHIGNYEKRALSQVLQLVGLQRARFTLEPRLSNFSLKYSKSANVWTAYCFNYHLSLEGESAKPECQVTWLMLKDENLYSVVKDGTLQGLPVADNVLSLLKTPDALNFIR